MQKLPGKIKANAKFENCKFQNSVATKPIIHFFAAFSGFVWGKRMAMQLVNIFGN